MRIRKQAKLQGIPISNVGFSGGSNPIRTECHFNQSPWDCLHLPLSSLQVGGEGDFELDISIWKTCFPVESVNDVKVSGNGDAAFLNKCVKKAPVSGDEDVVILCSKTDGKSWKCRSEVVEGQALCQHHLDQMKGYSTQAAYSSVVKEEDSVTTVASTRRKKRVAPTTSDPYYYYAGYRCNSGRRGARTEPGATKVDDNGHDQVGYIEDSDSDEDKDESEEAGKKRVRKPVKERSLKSLM